MKQGNVNLRSFTVTQLTTLTLLTLIAFPAAAFSAPAETSERWCKIIGTVKDGQGNPLTGAFISVLNGNRTSEIIATSRTDNQGRFFSNKLLPGLYLLRVAAEGFEPALSKPTQAEPDRPVIQHFTMRRASELLNSPAIDLVKYKAQRHRGIFQAQDGQEADAYNLDLPVPLFSETHGDIKLIAQSDVPAFGSSSLVTVNSTLSQRLSEHLNLVTTIQSGFGSTSPRHLKVELKAVLDQHRPSFALSYQRLYWMPESSSLASLSQFTVQAADTWQIGNQLLLIYGVDYSQLTNRRDTTWQPRLGIQWNPTTTTQVFADMTPSGSLNPISHINPDDAVPATSFATENVGAPTLDLDHPQNTVRLNRSRRIETGLIQRLDHSSTVETTLFLDTVSGHGIGLALLNTPGNPPDTEATPRTLHILNQHGTTSGVRLLYQRKLQPGLTLTAGYAVGKGQRLDSTLGLDQTELKPTRYQVITARIDTRFLKTGTNLAAMIRHTTGHPVFAIDPFQGRLTSDPGISIFITQELPFTRFLPGKWELLFEGRNILDQIEEPSSEQGLVQLTTSRRVLRGGVGMRF